MQRELRVTGIKPATVALYEGALGAIIGLGVSIYAWIATTINVSSETNSLLTGLLLGFSAGLLAVIVLPIIYFAFGWLVGIVHGFVINVLLNVSGGISVYTASDSSATYNRSTTTTNRGESMAFGEKIERPKKR